MDSDKRKTNREMAEPGLPMGSTAVPLSFFLGCNSDDKKLQPTKGDTGRTRYFVVLSCGIDYDRRSLMLINLDTKRILCKSAWQNGKESPGTVIAEVSAELEEALRDLLAQFLETIPCEASAIHRYYRALSDCDILVCCDGGIDYDPAKDV